METPDVSLAVQQLRPRKHGQGETDWVPRTTITLPYITGVSEEIRRVWWDYDVRVAFKMGSTLVKDPLPLEKQTMVVYRIPSSCGKMYIKKTVQRLELRLKEHKDACSRGQLEKSAITELAWRQDHCIEWDDAAVMDRASRHKELLVKEVLRIRAAAEKESLNRDGGVELHDCWIATVEM